MKLLFLTMAKISPEQRGIYSDLIRKFRDEGHDVYIVMPCERREGRATEYDEDNGVHTLSVRTFNLQKTNVIEKGIGQILLERQFKRAIDKYIKGVVFDLILYSTPPITFTNVIKSAKKNNPNAKTYLMLKDIFPQNALDLGMLSKNGVKGFIYNSFSRKEKELYKVSDFIGCMSPANINYLLSHNPDLDAAKVEICPNSYEVISTNQMSIETKKSIREKYGLPNDKPILLYGGNLGKPQGIPFLIKCIDENRNRKDCHFLIVGNGYDYPLIKKWYEETKPVSVSLLHRVPLEDYEQLAAACDIGLIFLDHRFTIPNYPSRLLPYLISKKPVIACTDPVSDIGPIAEENGYGVYCESNNVQTFSAAVDRILKQDLVEMGEKGYSFLMNNYTINHTYGAIMKHFK